jgi:hypothetical protein
VLSETLFLLAQTPKAQIELLLLLGKGVLHLVKRQSGHKPSLFLLHTPGSRAEEKSGSTSHVCT